MNNFAQKTENSTNWKVTLNILTTKFTQCVALTLKRLGDAQYNTIDLRLGIWIARLFQSERATTQL